jgi:hypothetical protein
VDNGIDDYNLLLVGNNSLLVECNDFKYHCQDLEKEVAEARSEAKRIITDLETKVKSAMAYKIEVAAVGEKDLSDFENRLVRGLEGLRELFVCNVQTIRGLSSQMPVGEPSVKSYLRRLSEEISGLPNIFRVVNENFATAAIEGALAMAGDSADPEVVRGVAAKSGVDILPAKQDVWRAA